MFIIRGKSDDVLKKRSCFAAHSSKVESTERRCFCSTVNNRGTNVADTRLAPKPLVQREISNSLATSLLMNRLHVTAFYGRVPMFTAAEPLKTFTSSDQPRGLVVRVSDY